METFHPVVLRFAMNMILSLQDPQECARFYQAGYWKQDTLYSLVRATAAKRPGAVALVDAERTLDYGAVLQCVDQVAMDLHEAGLREGDRVSIWLPNRIETAILMLVCSRMGYVCNTSLHRDYTTGEVLSLLKRASSSAFFFEEGFGADSDRFDIESRLEVLPDLKRSIRVRPLGEHSPDGRFGLGFAITTKRPDDLPFRTTPDRVVYLAFTSGTTGNPKGVMHSDNTLLSNARAIVRDFGFDESTVVYALSPMSHNMGIVGLVTAIQCGGTFVAHTSKDAKHAIDRIVATGASYLIGVPTHAIDLVADAQRLGMTSLGRVRTFQLGGSPISSSTVTTLMKLGVTLQNAFGMTENCSFQYTRSGDSPKTIIETCGRACAGMEMSVWDAENSDRRLGSGAIGELACRGASLMLGYFDDQASTERSFNREGWFLTGDLGSLDDSGNLRIVGRKKDLIIRGGHNIYPARIEELSMRHGNVLKAAAFPVADERMGEKVCLAIIPKVAGGHSGQDLLAHLDRQGLSKYDMPEYYLELESFPLTASGKILKRVLVEMARSGAIQPVPVRWIGPPKPIAGGPVSG